MEITLYKKSMKPFVKKFNQLYITDVPEVGGKNMRFR